MKRRALIAIAAGVTAGLAAFVLLQTSSVSKKGVKVGVGIKKAQAACHDTEADCLPDLDLVDTTGTVWDREALAGKVVMVNFWATWCAPCKREIPALSSVYHRHAEHGFVILGLMTDDVSDDALERFSSDYGLDYPVVRVEREIHEAFGWPDALPTTFLYDASGKRVFTRRGEVSEAELEHRVEELLAEAGAEP